MKLEIREYGDPVLREKSNPVRQVDESLRQLARDLLETMRAERGVGLAAQQVGRTESICVVQIPAEYDLDEHGVARHPGVAMPLILVNPEIREFSPDRESAEEGCLSFPGISAPIPRARQIRLGFLDLEGRPRELVLRDFLARVVQHEVDHLNGVLFIDRMSRLKRIAIAGQLRRMKADTGRRLAGS
jgi:peptide deformylase